MRVFHSLVYDENIESTNTATIDASWNSQLGLPDKLTIFALTDTVNVASTLNVQIEESPDQVHWMNKTGTAGLPELTLALLTTQNTLGVGRDNGTVPSAGFVRLKLWLVAGSAPKAHVRLWVTGRGEQIP